MYLFILESIGTQELILVGLIALIVFGPRKLPEMAKKFGSMMTEFKKVSGDFRSTWENAVNIEETETPKKLEQKEQSEILSEQENTIGKSDEIVTVSKTNGNSALPEVKKMSKQEFDNIVSENTQETDSQNTREIQEQENLKPEKTDWL